MKNNMIIRYAAKQHGVRLWEIAEKLGVSDATFSRTLRRELPEPERDKILTIIKEVATERMGES